MNVDSRVRIISYIGQSIIPYLGTLYIHIIHTDQLVLLQLINYIPIPAYYLPTYYLLPTEYGVRSSLCRKL